MTKLVRDKVPHTILRAGKKPTLHYAHYSEYTQALNNKLIEEVNEFNSKPSIEEIADIMEVLSAICRIYKYPKRAVESKRRMKARALGVFKKGIILEKVE